MARLPRFLQPLEFFGSSLPMGDIAEAIKRREESTPYLLEALEWVAENPNDALECRPEYLLHVCALYILAHFKEQRAFPWILELCHQPEGKHLLGDIITEGLPPILAATWMGDDQPLKDLAEDVEADEWVRSAAIEALGILSERGEYSRTSFSEYVGEMLEHRLDRNDDDVWAPLVDICVEYDLAEHIDTIRQIGDAGIAPGAFSLCEYYLSGFDFQPDPKRHAIQCRHIDDPAQEIRRLYPFLPESLRKASEFVSERSGVRSSSTDRGRA